MRDSVRLLAIAFSVACCAIATFSAGGASAQTKQEQPSAQAAPQPGEAPGLKQMPLSDKQIEGVLAAQKDVDAITEKLPDNGKPDPKVLAQLDEVAKKNGFSSYDEYNDVIDNISLVLGGIDPASKRYVGPESVIKAQIAQLEADTKLPAKDKQQALAEFNQALKALPPAVENKGNIELVTKYYDKLADALGDSDE